MTTPRTQIQLWLCLGGLALAGLLKGVTLISPAIASTSWESFRQTETSPIQSAEGVNADMMEPNTFAQANPTTLSTLVTANTQFGFNLFSAIHQEEAHENLMISPSSVAIALSMLYNGAAGDTQQAMADALELQGMSLENLNRANADLISSLESADPEVQLAIANSLWARQDVTFLPDFLQRNQAFYQAEVTTLDFGDPDSLTRINDWVAEQTQDKIPTILDEIHPDDVLYLINAIYFKGNWSREFDPALTEDLPFHLADGTERLHPMMTQRGEYRYLETETFQAVSLPYGGERLSMYVFMPREGEEFYEHLTAENWSTWMTQFHSRSGQIRIPRFQTEYDVDLQGILANMGMAIAFDPGQADFSNLSALSTVVDRVRHKTFIEVNEEGTEAAAVTAIIVRATSAAPMEPPFEMTVDRPFFYAIQDNQTGTLLFMGTVVNPVDPNS